MNNQPIGILDSGVGGLSIWREIVQKLPNESTIYAADSKNCPYGTKSSEKIYQLSKRLVQYLIKKQCKLIILACNTITVSCLDRLRKDFTHIPIIGTVPVVKTAAERTKNKRIGILSTKKTAKSVYQQDLINIFASGLRVLNHGTNQLVSFVERGELAGSRVHTILKKELQVFKNADIDVLALGCSHFPFLRTQFQEILGSKVLVLDSGAAIARQAKRVLTNEQLESTTQEPEYEFYTTGDPVSFKKIAKKLGGKELSDRIQAVKNLS